jgi:uncharacterized protein with ParB-like and HNH nuclease domain
MKGIQNTTNSTYRQLMGNGLKYEIPKFQRDYTWESEQWSDLWQDLNDLESGDESEHYMGYLVLQIVNNKNYRIIDGQQRLTTMSILILAILRCLNDLSDQGIDKDNNDKRREELLNSYIGVINPVSLISKNKLKLNRNSDDYYRQNLVLLKKEKDLPSRNINLSQKNMRECFLWFYEKIRVRYKTGESLAEFIDGGENKLGIVDKLFFTKIEVSDQLNAFKVFETLNARGVQLSSADLLKNYFFSVIDDSSSNSTNKNSEVDEVENIWSQIIEKLGDKKFEDYLRYYWNSYNATTRKGDLFKTIKKNITTKKGAFDLLRSLLETSDLYLSIHNPYDAFWCGNQNIVSVLNELNLFQIKQTNSILISGYKNLSIDRFTQLTKCCAVISFRYNIICGFNPNEQEVVYNSIAQKIHREKNFDYKDFKDIYVSDKTFEHEFSIKQFSYRSQKIIKYILSKICGEVSAEDDLFTIEHILPRSADNDWGDFEDENIDRSIYRLGNLTLLEKPLNKDAGILKYDDKKNIYSSSKCSLTSSIPINYDSWNEAKISDRQKQFAKEAKSIWKIQELNC